MTPTTEDPQIPQPIEAERATRAEEVIFRLRDTLLEDREFYRNYWEEKRETDDFKKLWKERYE